MIKIYRSVECKSDAEMNLNRLTWLLRFRHGGSSYVGHTDFSFSHTLLIFIPFIPPPLASMLPPSLRKIEEGGGGEKRAIQGERATERVLLEIFREYNMDKMSRRKTETRVKNV